MNQLDFDDVVSRGKRRGREAAKRVVEKWSRPLVETQVGRLVQQIAATPEVMELQDPAVMREMEARYGEN